MTSPAPVSDLPPAYLHEDRSAPISDVATAFIILTLVATGLRSWARTIQDTASLRADILTPLSLLFNLGTCTCLLLTVRYGAGKHYASLVFQDQVAWMKTLYVMIPVCYLPAVTLPKLAILDLYLQIFRSSILRWGCYVCGLIMLLNLVVSMIVSLTPCRPLAKTWYVDIDGKCLDFFSLRSWLSLPNVVTDLVMLILPIPVIVKLQRRWQTKLMTMLSFMVGSMGLIAAVVRFSDSFKIDLSTFMLDPSFQVVGVEVLTVVEPGVYHIAACSLTYRALFHWILHQSPLPSSLSRVFGRARERHSSTFSSGGSSRPVTDTQTTQVSKPGDPCSTFRLPSESTANESKPARLHHHEHWHGSALALAGQPDLRHDRAARVEYDPESLR